MAKSPFSMKLLIDTNSRRVLFAEADKDCVDFLFYLISLPLATVINILQKQGMVGSIGNLYKSIENLKEYYIQPNQTKNNILKPQVCTSSVPLLQIKNDPNVKKFYKCQQCAYFSDDPNTLCPKCSKKMTSGLQFVAPPPPAQDASGGGGFVKGVISYMVMDDLVVTPMSTISSITLLNKFNVKDVSALEEKVVNMGMDEAVKLLQACLQSKKVLTDVFLGIKSEKR